MSLAKRLSLIVPSNSNRGCRTCTYLEQLSPADRSAFEQWIADGHSLSQLWEVCCTDDPPLDISITGFRHHMKHHKPA